MISISKAMKQGRHAPNSEMFFRYYEGLEIRQKTPKNGDFGTQVISISKAMKQGRHCPDWDMFVRHSEGLTTRQNSSKNGDFWKPSDQY